MKKMIITGLAVVCLVPTLTGCASWTRFGKNINSEMSNGLKRDIKVYNADGKIIMEEKGKFDIKHTSRSLQYIDQKNNKHNIYFGDNTTVTVDELK
ncbi:hypothetical protein PGA94_09335 [Pediococcus pentosaceus]|uniref:beta-sandwich lipoprotein n=1 Tax=Pediococcus pentosaceus TaxID=1255 RepID=UPI0023307670|nr:hypothetical protein [Pediococcus pentosaceus]MDB1562976.1 hypothetical protein [Pediococcus pentosaceus]